MARDVPEWIGKTDSTPVPKRVKIRIAVSANYTCAICTRGAKPGDADHREPVVFSTPDRPLNRESNLQWLCIPCHKSKTRKDVADKARAAKAKKRMALTKEPKMKFSKRFDGTVTKWNPLTRRYEPLPQ